MAVGVGVCVTLGRGGRVAVGGGVELGGIDLETQTGALLSIAEKIDSICGCFSVGLIFTPLIGFLLILRYINRKEKAVLAEYGEK